MITLTINSADLKREEDKKLEEIRHLQFLVDQANNARKKEEMIYNLFNLAKEKIANEIGSCSFVIKKNFFEKLGFLEGDVIAENNFHNALHIVKELYEKAGYYFTWSYYSKSWYRKSGKYITIYVAWDLEKIEKLKNKG